MQASNASCIVLSAALLIRRLLHLNVRCPSNAAPLALNSLLILAGQPWSWRFVASVNCRASALPASAAVDSQESSLLLVLQPAQAHSDLLCGRPRPVGGRLSSPGRGLAGPQLQLEGEGDPVGIAPLVLQAGGIQQRDWPGLHAACTRRRAQEACKIAVSSRGPAAARQSRYHARGEHLPGMRRTWHRSHTEAAAEHEVAVRAWMGPGTR